MPTRSTVHPSAEVLRALALGKLNDSTASAVLNHLDSCPDCRKEVAAVTDDDFRNRLRQVHVYGSTPALPIAPGETVHQPQPSLKPTALYNLPPELADNPDYEVLRELGHGGMGVVYQAKHQLSGRVEVLKVMNKALLGQPESKERFLREIHSAARLDHKNVVKMYTALERGELMVLVMEYVPGEDLAQVVKACGPLPVLNACYYVKQAAMGLQHAFEKGMIHRDIKPQNLILAREGKKHIVKVLDFGLAKATRGEDVDTGLTNEGAMMGTPGYVAPEQSLDAATVDIRADIYSLGCTLYHLLAGTPPFSGKSAFEIMQAHHMVEARALNLVRPEVPEALAALVRKMMAKDAAQRYQTPIEVVRALEPFVKGALKPLPPQPAPPKKGSRGTTTIARVTKRAGMQRSRKWLAIVLLLGGLLGLIIRFAPRKDSPSADSAATPTREKDVPRSMTKAKDSPSADIAVSTVTNSIGMKLVLVKPGVFLMGSPPDEAALMADEHPQHEVEITRPFYVGVHEVTQEEYERVMRENPSSFSPLGGGQDKVKGMDTRQFPVECVSWKDAVEFCRRLSELPKEKSKGRTYRLPTEAEWEYICRGGPFFKKPSPPFHFGNSLSPTQANFAYPYGGAAKGQNLQRTTKVGSYPPNPLGIHDLHGNVCEWCADWYDAEYYKRSPRRDPQGPENGEGRVLRGGSWSLGGWVCRAAIRANSAPDVRGYIYGFRVVLVSGARN